MSTFSHVDTKIARNQVNFIKQAELPQVLGKIRDRRRVFFFFNDPMRTLSGWLLSLRWKMCRVSAVLRSMGSLLCHRGVRTTKRLAFVEQQLGPLCSEVKASRFAVSECSGQTYTVLMYKDYKTKAHVQLNYTYMWSLNILFQIHSR